MFGRYLRSSRNASAVLQYRNSIKSNDYCNNLLQQQQQQQHRINQLTVRPASSSAAASTTSKSTFKPLSTFPSSPSSSSSAIHHQQYRLHSTEQKPGDIEVNYITKDGNKITVYGCEGDNLMHLAQRNGIEIEGACEASLACCTCHVYVQQEHFDKLESPTEEEEDLLDMAPFLKPNSRLGCQVILTKDLAGIQVKLPPATRNFYVDGAKPSHH